MAKRFKQKFKPKADLILDFKSTNFQVSDVNISGQILGPNSVALITPHPVAIKSYLGILAEGTCCAPSISSNLTLVFICDCPHGCGYRKE